MCQSEKSSIFVTIRAKQIIDSNPYYDQNSYAKLEIDPDQGFGISRCAACDFVFASQVPEERFLEVLYGTGENIDEAIKVFARPQRAASTYLAISNLLSAVDARINRDEKHVPDKPVRILDVGCAFAVGSLGLAAQHYPYQISGVEISDMARGYLGQHGISTYKSIENLPEGIRFDGVLLNDVLEHVPDPVGFITKLHAHTHDASVIWVNVPNFIEWRLKETAVRINTGDLTIPKDLNPWEHLSYFSPQSLDALMGTIGASRLRGYPVPYPVQCKTATELARSLIRAARDFWRIYRNRYPQQFTTSSIYVFDQ